MKTKYIKLLWVFALALTFGFASCSSDDDPIVDESIDLSIADEKVDIVVGAATSVSISSGNGDYRAFSLNEDIVAVELVGNELQLTGVSSGETAIIVSDKNSIYKRVEVRSFYDKLIVEDSNVEMKMRLGNTGRKTITILGGNGGYKAVSSDPAVATATVSGNDIVVTGSVVGSAIITVTDKFDIQTEITVTIVTTTIAYEGEELEEILQSNVSRFYFNGEAEYMYSSPFVGLENDYNVYGWDYYGYYYQKVYFKGDKSVGVKEDAKFSQSYRTTHRDVPIDFEIVKNDGVSFWAIFSFIQNGKLFYGYFVRPL